MAVFIVLASFLSAGFVYPAAYGPASVLTFPFYADASYPGGSPYLPYRYEVHLSTLIIYSTELLSFTRDPFYFALSLFLLVNSLGAALGYLINKAHIFPKNYSWRGLLLLIALGIIIFGVGVWLYNLPPVWSELQGRYIYPYGDCRDCDASRFWIFGLTWIAVVVGDFLLHRPKK